MKGIVTIIDSAGKIVETDVSEPVTLEMLKLGVGGHIEHVPMFDLYKEEHCVAFCNEEGKLLKLPVNMLATMLWMKQRHPFPIGDVLCGNVIIVRGDNELMEAL
jgi:hypothetical protein